MPTSDQPRRIRLRFAGRCCSCLATLAADTWAVRVPALRTIECLPCGAIHRRGRTASRTTPPEVTAPPPTTAPPEATAPADAECGNGEHAVVGHAGSSALREHRRRRRSREERIRAAHPRIADRLLTMTDEPQSIRAWAIGSHGERRLGRALDALAERGVRVLHDHRLPRSRANIDHIAIGPSGVHVIDAKRYAGRVRLHARAGRGRRRVERLLVDSQDCTDLISGVHRQVDVVRAAIARSGAADVPVRGVLCFVEADWPLTGADFALGGVRILSPAVTASAITAPGPLAADAVHALHRTLATALVPA